MKWVIVLVLFLVLVISGCEDIASDAKKSPRANIGEKINLSDIPAPEIISYDENDSLYEQGKLHLKLTKNEDFLSLDDALNKINSITNRNNNLASVLNIKKIFTINPGVKNYELKKEIGLDRWVEITISNEIDVLNEVEKWLNEPEIEIAILVQRFRPFLYPSDPQFEYQWHHENTGDNLGFPITPDADIDSVEAWNIEYENGVLVTNQELFEWDHEDLIENVWQNFGEDSDGDGSVVEWNEEQMKYVLDIDDFNEIDDDENGYIDDLIGWDFFQDTGNISASGDHGTKTAGALLAKNNELGVIGVCPNCKMLTTDHTWDSSLYAIDNGVKVMSASFGGGHSNPDIVNYGLTQNVVFILGAGNNGKDLSLLYLCENINMLCVSASNEFDELFSWSNWGKRADIGAPGGHIRTTYEDNNYWWAWGTSLSAPLVAGVAGLVISKNPSLHSHEVYSIIQSSADPFINTFRYGGTGRMNAHKAMQMAESSLLYGSFPIALIDSERTFQNSTHLKIYGSASSPDFSKLRILIGDYYSPDSYELIYETSNVTSDLIYELSMEDVNLGSNLLKIEVEDIHGQIAFDTFPFYKDCFAGCIYNGNQYFTGIPKLADLNGDGVEEIIFATTDYNVHVIDAEGIELPGWPLHMSSRLGDKASFSIADINSDNLLEIIFATTNGDVHVLEQNASYLPSWPIEIGSYNSNQLTPMVADINNDGKLEIISGLNGEINVYDEQANLIEGWPVEIGSNNFKYMTIGDINSDGNLEIIIPYGGTVYALNSEGDILEGFPLDLYASGIENPTLVDIDNDKKLDLIFQSTEDIYVYNSDGSIKEGWPAPNHNSFAWENNLIVSDVSENGLLEIITTDNDKLRVFSNGGDEIFSYEENFIDLLSVFDIDDDGENEIILEYRNQILTLNFQGIIESEWNYMASNLYKYVTFSDIQQDGIIEIIGFSNDKGIYVFETNGKISQIVDWFTINHDNYNSRNYHFDGDYISPKNLLKNPSLETDIGHDYYPNWDLDDSISGNDLPDGWKYWNGGDAEGIIDYSKSYSGENSFKISLSEIIEEDRNAIYQDVPIIYKNKYKVSGYVKTNCLDENCYGTILTTCRDENHNQIYNCGFHVPEEDIQRVFGNSDWTKIEYILEGTNRDADYIRVYCYHTPWNSEYPNPGAGTVWCDDFKVEELPKPEEELPVITTIRQPLQPKEIQEELDKKTKELPESKQKLSPLQSFWEKILEILF